MESAFQSRQFTETRPNKSETIPFVTSEKGNIVSIIYTRILIFCYILLYFLIFLIFFDFFRRIAMMCATDVAARGIDVKDVSNQLFDAIFRCSHRKGLCLEKQKILFRYVLCRFTSRSDEKRKSERENRVVERLDRKKFVRFCVFVHMEKKKLCSVCQD